MKTAVGNHGLQFRHLPPSTGGTYRSARLSVRGPYATGRIPIARARSSPVCRRRSRAVTARRSQALFLPHGEKDRGDVAEARTVRTARYQYHTGTEMNSVHRYGPRIINCTDYGRQGAQESAGRQFHDVVSP
ncbi:hypothetical protein BHM03_00028946 [Ensete ventricosum]|nr:hypothetical protein BHM03_00028946 [Ensete ventricosum]